MIHEQIAPAIGDAIVAYSENPQAFLEERFVDERFVLTRRIIGEISQIGALAIAEAAREIVAVLAQQSPEPGFWASNECGMKAPTRFSPRPRLYHLWAELQRYLLDTSDNAQTLPSSPITRNFDFFGAKTSAATGRSRATSSATTPGSSTVPVP